MATDRRTRQELIDEVTRLQAQLDESAGEPPALEVAERLRESEARYRAIYELSPVGIGLSTSEGRVVSCNQAMAAMTGYTIEELKTLRLADTFVDDDERRELLAELEQHGRITDFPVRLKRKDGSVYCALLSITLIDLDGRPHLHTICQDITERVRAEEALRHEHALLERITSTSPIGITVVDRTGLITFANTRAEEILGFTRDGIKDRTYNDPEWRITAIDGSPFPDENLPFEVVRRTGREVFDFRHAIEWPDGRRVLLSINAAPLTDTDGRFDGIVATLLNITDRVRATEKLRTSEEKYRLISENIPVAVYSALPDEHSTTLLITGQVEELSGYTRKEYLDDPALWPSIVLPEDRDRVWHAIEEHRARRSILDVEYRIIHRNGGIRWIRDRAMPVCNDDGGLVRIDGYMEDISERRRSEEALQRSEAKLRRIIEASTDGIVMGDESGTVVEWNAGMERITGLEKEKALNRPLWDVLIDLMLPHQRSRENYEQYRSEIMAVLQSGRSEWFRAPIELEIQRPDGARRHIQALIYPIRTREGWMLGNIVRDVTVLQRTERALRRSEERYRELVEKAGIGIMMDDLSGETTFFNDQYAVLFGYTAEEISTLSRADLIHPGDLDRVTGIHRGRLRGEDVPARYEFRGLRKDGSTIHLEVSAVALYEEDRPVGTRAYVWDITDRKRAEETLQYSLDQLRHFSAYIQNAREDERAEIARTIHDELGQNLTALRMDLARLKKLHPPSGQDVEELFDVAAGLVGETVRTVQQLAADLRPGLLDDLGITAAITWLGEEFEKAMQISCSVHLEPEELDLDPDRSIALYRIVQEALTNITRHAGASHVTINLIQSTTELTLEIIDDGRGISEKQVTAQDSLGLLGMKERARLMGGTFSITGRRNRGTTVTAVFPVPDSVKS